MSGFLSLFPKPTAVMEHEPEDLAALLMEYLHSLDWGRQREVMCTSFITSQKMVPPCDQNYKVHKAVLEAWDWLVQAGLVVQRPEGNGEKFDFSRRGEALKTRMDVAAFQMRARLPRHLLHQAVAEKAWPLFLRGEYDTCVFQAFKEVEVAVRVAGRYSDNDYGKDMLRKAFRPAKEGSAGPLADTSEPDEEQKSLQEFIAGAYGRARNPTAHRHGVLTDPTEAFEMLVVASHLLRVVDRRRPTP